MSVIQPSHAKAETARPREHQLASQKADERKGSWSDRAAAPPRKRSQMQATAMSSTRMDEMIPESVARRWNRKWLVRADEKRRGKRRGKRSACCCSLSSAPSHRPATAQVTNAYRTGRVTSPRMPAATSSAAAEV